VDRPGGAPAGRLLLQPGAQPAPGYELVRFLGRGGFGEVWRATGPGGFPVALKLIPLGDHAGDVELRSVELIKEIRHANLLGHFGAWQREGVLVMAMELADSTLMDRLREALRQGLPGIPVGELREHLRDAARGLDHLNSLGVQHRDVKPQNLLLVGGSVKVADFGLAKLLGDKPASNSGSMTPAYAAPEYLRGKVSPHSDQYALAVTYCELRGGRLPFAGDQAQILTGHLMNPPDLTMLAAAERPAVAKALTKKPEDRWPSCRAFVQALADADARDVHTAPPPPTPSAAPTPTRRRPTPQAWWAMAVAAALVLLTVALPVALIWFGPRPGRPVANPTPPPAVPALHLPAIPSVSLETGEAKTMTVRVERDHLTGPIRLEVAGLPDGVRARPAVVPDGEDSAEVELTAADTAAPGAGRATLTARAGDVSADGPLEVTVALGREYVNSLGMRLVRIRPGTFTMGSPGNEEGHAANEGPRRQATITRTYYLGACPVTKGQFAAFVKETGYKTDAEKDGQGGWGYNAATRKYEGRDPMYSWRYTGWEQTDNHPVVNVTWNDATEFCKWLSKKEGRVYELPTEAEWEFACRAGTTTAYSFGDDPKQLGDYAWYSDNSDGRPHAVGGKKPNPWGLYDLHGNVFQWCADWYGDKYESGPVKDPKGPAAGKTRVVRGGSWNGGPNDCRSANRVGDNPGDSTGDTGFRAALRPPAGTP
jgi:formylglycine-generating enzyme required for sulfatase activity